jgi:hypothetical protein
LVRFIGLENGDANSEHCCVTLLRDVEEKGFEKMEEAQEKLEKLLKSARENKIELRSLKIPRKFEKHLKMSFRWKMIIFASILAILYGRFSHLLNTSKVCILILISDLIS